MEIFYQNRPERVETNLVHWKIDEKAVQINSVCPFYI